MFTLVDIDLEEKPGDIKKLKAAHEVTIAEWKKINEARNEKVKSLMKNDKN